MMPLHVATTWIVALILCSAVWADVPVQDEAARLETLRAQMKSLTRTLNNDQDSQNKLHGQLGHIEKEISRIVQAKSSAALELKQLQADLISLKNQHQQSRHALVVEQALFGKQVRASYILGRSLPMKVILAADDPKSISRNLIYLGHFNRVRAARLQRISGQLIELNRLQAAIEKQRQLIADGRAELQVREQDLAGQLSQRRTVLAKLNRRIKKKKTLLQQMEADKKRLKNLIKALRMQPQALIPSPHGPLTNLPFAQLRGKLMWPVAKHKGIIKHGSGVVFVSKTGQPVHAAAAGKVVFAQWLRGYGLLMILDHGQGYMTLYGYNQTLIKGIAESVEAGEIIATAGRSGGQTKSGVYFEVRINGKVDNPLRWVIRSAGNN